MNTTYTQKSIIAIIATVFAVVMIGSFMLTAVAAPNDDYFTDTTQDAQNDFIAWFSQFDNSDTGQCDAYDAIFSVTCVNSDNETNFSSLAGVAAWFAQFSENNNSEDDPNETEPTNKPFVTLLDQRCVNDDGVIEVGFTHVSAYELKRGSDIYAVADLSDDKKLDFQTLAGLPDGNYLLTVFNTDGYHKLSFEVDCDIDEADEIDKDHLSAVCGVYPNDPSIDDPVTWQVSASGGESDYSYEWYGNVHGTEPSITVTYNSSGTKEGYATVKSGTEFRTVRCEVEVEEEGEVMGVQTPTRTIEEF